MEKANKINWYVGSMKKSVDNFKEVINKVDFVIEILDARAINSSSNNEIVDLFKNKVIVKIALKKDLLKKDQIGNSVFSISTKDHKDKPQLLNYLKTSLSALFTKELKKGIRNPTFCGIVIGLPNIGKSSFINFISQKSAAIAQNTPGFTKKLNLIKINDWMYLFDTPGIFFKNIEDFETGYKLGLINCLNRNISQLNKTDLFTYLLGELKKRNLLNLICIKYDIDSYLSIEQLIDKLIEKKLNANSDKDQIILSYIDDILNDEKFFFNFDEVQK